MSWYSAIDRRINADAWFRGLTIEQQWLWFRLLTGQHVTSVAGLWSATEEGLAGSLKIPVKKFRTLFAAFEGRAFADWEAGVIYLPNALKIEPNQPKNERTLKGWIKTLELVPECALRDRALNDFRKWILSNASRFPNGVPDGFPAPRLTVKETVTDTVTQTVTDTVTETVSDTLRARARPNPDLDLDPEPEQETEDPPPPPPADEPEAADQRVPMTLAWVLPDSVKQGLMAEMIPDWCVDAIWPRARTHFAADPTDRRRPVDWDRDVAKWVRGDFRDPKRRPTKPEAGDDPSKAAEHQAALEAQRLAKIARLDAEAAAAGVGKPRDLKALLGGIAQ